MLRKCIAVLLSLISIVSSASVFAAQTPFDAGGAKAALLVCADTGDVVFEKNADEPIEAAGLKRLAALLAVCRAFDEGRIGPETVVTVSADAAKQKGATAFLSANERISAGELLKAAIMLTAGDAILALLSGIFPQESEALGAVNRVLEEAGVAAVASAMGEGRAFTLNELKAICLGLAESSAFLRYSSSYTDVLRHEKAPSTELVNPNRLVRHYSGCFGLATGSVGASEYAGAFIARRGGTTFLVLLAGMPDSGSRARLASSMLDYAFSAFRTYEAAKAGGLRGSVPVTGGEKARVEAVDPAPVMLLVPVSSPKLTLEPELYPSVEAPIREGDVIGKLIIKDASGNILAETPIAAKEAVNASSFGFWFMEIIKTWLRL